MMRWLIVALLASVMGCSGSSTKREKYHFALAVNAMDSSHWTTCIAEFSLVLEENKKSFEAFMNRAICRLEGGDAAGAVEDASAAIRLNDTIEGNYLVRASAFEDLGKMAEAETDLRKARDIAPKSAYVWVHWAQHHTLLRQYSTALSDLDSAMILDPENKLAIAVKGSVLVFSKRYQDAVDFLRPRIQGSGRQLVTNLTNLGFAESQLGMFSEAKSVLENAMRLDSMNDIVWNNLGYTTFKLGDTLEGIRMIGHAISLNPANAYAHYNHGLISLAQGNNADACGRWRNATGLGFAKKHGPEADSMIDRYCGRTKHLKQH